MNWYLRKTVCYLYRTSFAFSLTLPILKVAKVTKRDWFEVLLPLEVLIVTGVLYYTTEDCKKGRVREVEVESDSEEDIPVL